MTKGAKRSLDPSHVWLVLLFLFWFFADDLLAILWVMTLPLWLALYLWRLVLIIVCLVHLIKDKDKRAPLVSLSVLIAALLFLHTVGIGWLQTLRFQFKKRQYEATVARILADQASTQQEESGRDCLIDEGPPLRVAFIQHGILDNFVAIVYDPTGLVMEANKFKRDWSNWSDPKLAHAKRLFGGDLLWAQPLGGHWYRCDFT